MKRIHCPPKGLYFRQRTSEDDDCVTRRMLKTKVIVRNEVSKFVNNI